MDQFEKTLEMDIGNLAEQVKNIRELPEMKNATEAEILKEAIRAFPQSSTEKQPQAQPAASSAASDDTAGVLPVYAQGAAPEIKLEIEYIIDVAFRDGLGKALSEAKKSSPFVEDAVRDALAGRLYPELQKRGVLK